MSKTLALCNERNIPVFGVCLGLQGIAEYCGGRLGTLAAPMHGKPSTITHRGGPLFEGLPEQINVGRYHSLHADYLPDCLRVMAQTDDGVVMAIEHRTLPMLAVQFHPESIMSQEENSGRTLVGNVVQYALAIAQQRASTAQETQDDARHYAQF